MGERQSPFRPSCGVGIGRGGCPQLLYEGLAVVGQQRALQHDTRDNIMQMWINMNVHMLPDLANKIFACKTKFCFEGVGLKPCI